MADPGGVRIGDAERQRVVDMLGRHTGEGRLTLDEFAERAGQVYAAQTRAELEEILADLPEGLRPSPATPTARPRQPTTTPTTPRTRGDGVEAPRRRSFVGIMCASQARGPWRAPRDIRTVAFWGHVDIDLTNASIDSPVVDILARAYMGSVKIRVPEGIPVEVNGFVLMGGTQNMVRNVPVISGAPLIRVRVRGLWGGVVIKNPRRKRVRDALNSAHHRHHGRKAKLMGHGIVNDVVADAWDAARTSIDRALGMGDPASHIPDVPNAEREPAPTTHTGSTPAPAPAPAPPPPPPVPPPDLVVPGVGDVAAAPPENNGAAKRRIPTGTLTILVSDIVGSTQLQERLGDQSWLAVLESHNAIVREHVDDHGGTEVKAQGDGFLVVFASARSAVLAAIDIQNSMADYRESNPDVPVTLRVGLHTGEVVATEDDVFGQNVVVASRISAIAEPGEIVVSGLTRDLTASASDLGFGTGQDVILKGISQPWRVHRVKI